MLCQAVDDLDRVLASVVHKYPSAPLLGVGFSFGGQVLTSYMGQHAEDCAFTAGVAISSLFEVTEVYKHVEGTVTSYV